MAFQLVDFAQLIGQITTTQIAPGSITTPLLAANIVKAGIVDGTTITGAQIVADGTSGDFLAYTGPPASGNLLASVSPVQGTDSQGNTFYAAITSYQTGSGFYAQLLSGGLQWGTTGNQPNAAPNILGTAVAAGAGITLFSGKGGSTSLGVVLLLTDAPAAGQPQVVVSASTPALGHGLALFEVEGTAAATQLLTMTIPGLLASWQAASLNANFAAGGTSPRYQLEGMNGKRVRLSGAVNITGAVAAFTAMFNLPAGYRPSRQIGPVPASSNSGGLVLGVGVIQINTNGDVLLVPATAAGKFVDLDAISFELD